MAHNYWLFKSEAKSWSWEQHCALGAKGIHWDGVRNHQANNNMKAMQIGDLGFFYHSVTEKRVMGIVKITSTHYPDHTDKSGRFGMVDVVAVQTADHNATLEEIKATPALADMVLVKNARLSVQPVRPNEWKKICAMCGLDPSGQTHNAF